MVAVIIIDFIENFIPPTKHKNLENMNELTDKNLFEIRYLYII